MAFRIFKKLSELLDVNTAGAADGDALTFDAGTSKWIPGAGGGGGGAPTDVDYLVGTANGTLSAEIVVGTSPGGELGGTWASPTVDATHSGSSHAAVQAAAEATAASALSTHSADTTGVHGIADTSALETTAGAQAKVDAHVNDATDAHAGTAITNTPAGGIAATTVQAAINELDSEKAATASAVMDGDAAGGVLSGTYPNPGFASDMATQAELDAHVNDTSAAHAASAISADSTTLVGTGTDVQAVLEELDNGIADHLADTSAAHAATAISFTPAGTIASTTVQAAIEEVASEAGGGGVPSLQYESRSSNTILGVADKGKTIDITAAITQTFEADETLGDGWWVILRNATQDGTTVVTLDPAGTETIDGLATVTMYSGESRMVFCDGAGGNFHSLLLSGGFARFTADGNFVIPHGISTITVECTGGGGGGGGGSGRAVSNVRKGGSGGGGGARVRAILSPGGIGSPGDLVAVDIAAGGTQGSAGSGGNGGNGGPGGNTTFGSFVTGYGGGGGFGGNNGANTLTGGSGGGSNEAGTNGADNTATRGGGNNTAALGGMGQAGGGSGTGAMTAQSAGAEYGGAGGANVGGAGNQSNSGGGSSFGGPGGGSGGGVTNANPGTQGAGGAGGANSFSVGGGGAGGAVGGNPGTDGADSVSGSGTGGGGGGGHNAGTGGAGGAGGDPGGGGGGGAGGTSTGGIGGLGGRGECRVWYA